MSGTPSDGKGGRRPQPARASKPTPVRALDDVPSPREAPGPMPERKTFPVEGQVWLAEVMGHARGSGSGGPGLLLVRFEPEVGAGTMHEDSSPARLESWLVAERLAEVSESHLASALAKAQPWRGVPEPPPFFAEEGGRRGR